MAESLLWKSYRDSERAKAERELDEALARMDAQEASQPQSPPAPVAEPAPAPASQVGVREPGVIASIKRGLSAIPERFVQGGQQVADAIYARDRQNTGAQDEEGSGLQAFLNSRPVQFTLGLLNVVFPFSAFAGEVGGDAGQWAARATGKLTDASLKERLAALRGSGESIANDPMQAEFSQANAPQAEIAVLEHLLTMSEAERLESFREFSGALAEALSGTIAGFTSTAKPVRR